MLVNDYVYYLVINFKLELKTCKHKVKNGSVTNQHHFIIIIY